MDEHWSELGAAYEGHLNRFFNYVGDDRLRRQGHFEKPKYRWVKLEAPPAKHCPAMQAWAEGAEWLARRLREVCARGQAWLSKGTEGDVLSRKLAVLGKGLLDYPIVAPLLAKRAPDQIDADLQMRNVLEDGEHSEAEGEDDVLPLVSEGENP